MGGVVSREARLGEVVFLKKEVSFTASTKGRPEEGRRSLRSVYLYHGRAYAAERGMASTFDAAAADAESCRDVEELVDASLRRHVDSCVELENLAVLLRAGREPEGELRVLEALLQARERQHGRQHREVAAALARVADAHARAGNSKTRAELLERAYEIAQKTFSPHHRFLGSLLASLGSAYGQLSDVAKQKECLEKALVVHEVVYSSNDLHLAHVLVNLGNAAGELGDLGRQRHCLERALAIEEYAYGETHAEVASTLVSLGGCYADMGEPASAKEVLERALAIEERWYGRNHVELASTLSNLGAVREPGPVARASAGTFLESL